MPAPSMVRAMLNRSAPSRSAVPLPSVSTSMVRLTRAKLAVPVRWIGPSWRIALLIVSSLVPASKSVSKAKSPVPVKVPLTSSSRLASKSMVRSAGTGSSAPGFKRSGVPSASKSKALVQSRRVKPSATWLRLSADTVISAVSSMGRLMSPLTVTSPIFSAV